LQPRAFKDYLDGLFPRLVMRLEDAPKINHNVLTEFYEIVKKRRYYALGEEDAARDKMLSFKRKGNVPPPLTAEETELVCLLISINMFAYTLQNLLSKNTKIMDQLLH